VNRVHGLDTSRGIGFKQVVLVSETHMGRYEFKIDVAIVEIQREKTEIKSDN
jgi:hypothetical protein